MKPVIILVSPKGAANLGGIARVMANFGVDDLRIVDPRCELNCDESRMMSLKAFPIIENANIFESLSEAQRDLEWSFAFSVREADVETPQKTIQDFFSDQFHKISETQKWGMVFGREDHGLDREEIRLCNLQIRIPTSEIYASLNIVSAVGIALYAWSNSSAPALGSNVPKYKIRPKKNEEEIFFDGLFKLLKEINFLRDVGADEIRLDLRNMFHRADLSDRDLRILFGIIADLEYRLGKKFFHN